MEPIAAPPMRQGRFNPDPERSYALPGHYYFDPEIARRERDAIFLKSWLIAAYSHDLKEPGTYVTAEILGQPIFVVRGKDGVVRGFYNVCRHRGHLLLKGRGQVGGVRCPFHSWNYDFTGRLVGAPNAAAVPGFDKAEFRLNEIRVVETGRMIFVNLDPAAPDFADDYPGLVDEFLAMVPGYNDLSFFRRDEYTINANWKSVFDGLECYHCPYLHPGSMGKAGDRMQESFESTDFAKHARHVIRGNRDVFDTGKGGAFGVAANAALKDLNMWYVWPNILFMAHPGPSNFKVAHVWPTGPESCVRYIDQFTSTNPPSEHDLAQMTKHRITFEQDIAAMESVQRGVHARTYTPGRLMVDRERSWQSEHATHHFQNLVWTALNGAQY